MIGLHTFSCEIIEESSVSVCGMWRGVWGWRRSKVFFCNKVTACYLYCTNNGNNCESKTEIQNLKVRASLGLDLVEKEKIKGVWKSVWTLYLYGL